jgi:toxin YoeB
MRLIFSDDAWEDYLFWQKQDRRMVDRINKLLKKPPESLSLEWASQSH